MNTSRIIQRLGVALVALALIALPALAVTSQNSEVPGGSHALGWIISLGLSAGLVGVVTYAFPVGGATAPTQIQSSQIPVVTGTIVFADADTSLLFTHNFGLSTGLPGAFTGGQPGLLSLFPEIGWYQSGVTTVAPVFSFTLTSGNAITFSKTSLLGTGGTIIVAVRRPWNAAG